MLRKLVCTIFFVHFIVFMFGQIPKLTGVSGAGEIEPRDCSTRTAGTVSFGPIVGQSNNGLPDTIFLCYGDYIFVKHNRDANFTDGDPDPSTPAALGYLLYSCRPTVSGNDYNAIFNDCVMKNPAPPVDSLWYMMGTPNGDINLVNDGGMNQFFNGGDPFVLWFAPSTFDSYQIISGEYYGGFESPSCIRVSTQAAFPVVYLNEIKIENYKTNSATSFAGSFDITGGLPEFDLGRNFSITMTYIANPTINAALNVSKNGDQTHVLFNAPRAGNYRITITDGFNCSTTFDVSLPAGEMSVNIESGMVNYGENICIDVTVEDFVNFLGGQFVIQFDPTKLSFDNLVMPSPAALPPTVGFNTSNANITGQINFLWTSANLTPLTLPDNTVIFTLCFKAIGPPGTKTDVAISKRHQSLFFDDNSDFIVKSKSGTIMINNPLSLVVEARSCSTTGTSGKIEIVVYGPEGQYNIEFNNSGSVNVINNGEVRIFGNLAPGSYSVRVFNGSNTDMKTVFITISSSSPININDTIDPPTCSDTDDGSITLNISGGSSPYSLEWSNFVFNNAFSLSTISNLGNGLYSVTITDQLGCQTVESFAINTTPIILDPPTIVDPMCSGSLSGSITLTASGGTPRPGNTYNYLWSGGFSQSNVTSSTYSNLKDGTYYVTVTDANGCSAESSFTLSPGVKISVVVDSAQLVGPDCFEDKTGHILVYGNTDGLVRPPYTFSWSPNNGILSNTPTSSELSNLAAGIYTVTVSDANGCTSSQAVNVLGVPKLTINTISIIDDDCNSVTPTGAITIVGSGGTPFINSNGGYWKFEWTDGTSTKSANGANLTINNLKGSGTGITYTITITDSLGCMTTEMFTILKANSPSIVFDTLNPITCANGNDGSIQAIITANGSPITNVNWSPNSGSSTQSGNVNTIYNSTISNLTGGVYVITVTAQNGCQEIDSVELQGTGNFEISNSIIGSATCIDIPDGTISLTLSGGQPPYNIQWSNGQSGSSLINLTSGSYDVTITDGSQCPPVFASFIVPTLNPPLEATIGQIVPASCGLAVGDGGATVNVTGGNGNAFNYLWSSGETSSTASMLNGGNQSVTITDGVCTIVENVVIPTPNTIAIDTNNSVIQNVTCYGYLDGSINLSVSGGNGSLDYQWSQGNSTSNLLNQIGAGVYIVTITDTKNCQMIDTFTVIEPDTMVASFDPSLIHEITCFNTNDGGLTVSYTGGNGGNVNYTWNPLVAGNVSGVTNLGPNIYNVVVTDSKGCTAQATYELVEPAQIIVDFGPVPEPACYDSFSVFEINNVAGGQGPSYQYQINGGVLHSIFDPSDIKGGENLLTIIDENGCKKDTLFTLDQPLPVLVNLPDEIKVNLGDSVLISPVINSVFPIDNISWQSIASLSCLVCDQTYAIPNGDSYVIVTATDVNGCVGIDSTLIKVDKSRKIVIPNAFSPNGDGINDFFQVFTGAGVEKIDYIRVFDRFGACVFEQNNAEPNEFGTLNGWDGRYKGLEQNPGVYAYVVRVTFLDQVHKLYFGDLTLIK